MSKNNIIVFSFKNQDVQVIKGDQGEYWWLAKEICDILGISNPTEAMKRLDCDEKSTLRISEGGPERNIVNEPGLYKLVMKSTKPQAKEFTRWITHEVLPSIRKTGSYSLSKNDDPILAQLEVVRQLRFEQIKQATQIKELYARVPDGDTGYMTAIAYARMQDKKTPLSLAQKIGRKAGQICRDTGITIGKVPDERWGQVNSYPVEVLDEVFEEVVA